MAEAGVDVPQTSARSDALRRFAAGALADAGIRVETASADASFRSYWRATLPDGATRIVMDAPPDKEDIDPWLDIGARLHRAGLHTPEVFAVDRAQGFVLMEDLGTRDYLSALNDTTVDALYADALDALLRMQCRIDAGNLAAFDEAFLTGELELMPEWFLRRHLGHAIECDEWDVIELAFRTLISAARAQPQVFMHRDYHSRNLLVVDGNNPGIIDFQGALNGPLTYDLASLLRDCYIAWDSARVDGWVEEYLRRLRHTHLLDAHVDAARFRRWFDLAGLQRHLKVLGIFCRLWYRDRKPQYLADLPLVWRYVITIARTHREFAALADLLERALGGRDITRARDEAIAS